MRNAITVPDDGGPSLAAITVHLGMYPGLTYRDNPETYGFPNHADPTWGERDTVEEVLAEIGRRFSGEPGRYLFWYLAGKPVMLLSWDMVQGAGDVFIYPVRTSGYHRDDLLRVSHRLMEWLHWPLTALALAGALLVWLPSVGHRLGPGPLFTVRALSLILAYFLAVHIAGAPLPRYAIPLRPVLFGLAMLPAALLLRRPAR